MKKYSLLLITGAIVSSFFSIASAQENSNPLPKIATHEHYRIGANLKAYFEVAARLGIQKSIFVPTGANPDNKGYEAHQRELLKMQTKYPEKIIAFCTINEQDKKAYLKFRNCIKWGGKGLKLLGGHPGLYDEPLNSPNMMKVYKIAQKYKIPVLFHGSILNIPETEGQIRDFLGKFPDVTFIQAHYCSATTRGVQLEKCAKLLDDFPNLYIDGTLGGGLPGFIRQIQDPDARKKVVGFINNYQDRIVYSSDIILTKNRSEEELYTQMSCDSLVLEKSSFLCPAYDKEKEAIGLNLPEEILKKIYTENAKRIYGF